ncbi:MAG: HEAT repeat domain-containing protein [Gemmatales bacterium]|nr:HEAT repeat domain-containing protein [Gemmatales bacterium]MDW8387830.1 HEAT repeat domain-containing protein [Gemmatales bacterium]
MAILLFGMAALVAVVGNGELLSQEPPSATPRPEVLVRDLDSNDPVVRTASASLLAELAESSRSRRFRPGVEGETAFFRQVAGAALARHVTDPVPSVRRAVVGALAQVRAEGPTATAAWSKALADEDVVVRREVVAALREYFQRSAELAGPLSYREQLPPLTYFLQDIEATASLVRRCLESEDPFLRQGALKALDALLDSLENLPDIAGRNVDPLAITEEAVEPVRQAVVPAVSAIRSLLPPVVQVAATDATDTRRQAVRIVEKVALLCDPRPDLFERREGGTGRQRGRLHRGDLGPGGREAITLLQEGLKDAVPGILPLLRQPPVETQRAVLDAFEVIGPIARQAVPEVRVQLRHADPFVRWAAARALAAIGPTGDDSATVTALAERISDDDLDVATAACRYLGDAFAKDALPALPALSRAAASEERQLQHAAVLALEDIANVLRGEAKAAVPGLIVALQSPDLKTRQLAPLILGTLGPAAEAAVPALEKALRDEDPDVRQRAGQALLKIRSR